MKHRFLGDGMKKVNLAITLITQNAHEEYNLIGKQDEINDRLIYREPSTNIEMIINKRKKQMIRDSDNYRMIMYFDNSERIELILKEENKMLEIKIKTIIYDDQKDHFHVKYLLAENNEEIEYIIDSDEVKE